MLGGGNGVCPYRSLPPQAPSWLHCPQKLTRQLHCTTPQAISNPQEEPPHKQRGATRTHATDDPCPISKHCPSYPNDTMPVTRFRVLNTLEPSPAHLSHPSHLSHLGATTLSKPGLCHSQAPSHQPHFSATIPKSATHVKHCDFRHPFGQFFATTVISLAELLCCAATAAH